MHEEPVEVDVEVGDGVTLRARTWAGTRGDVLLVHGLASNARLWDGVAERVAAAGQRVVAVDQRGHGRSDRPDDGLTVAQCAADLATVIDALGLDRPVVAGQSWGGNVVLQLTADHPGRVGAVVLVDGGWIRLRATFPDWTACAEQLRPPSLAGTAVTRLEGAMRVTHPDWPASGISGVLASFEVLDDGTVRPWLSLDHHLAILRDLWDHDPREQYGRIPVPVLLVPADHGSDGSGMAAKRQAVAEAIALLPDGRVHWFGPPADHDLHAQHPAEVAALVLGAATGAAL